MAWQNLLQREGLFSKCSRSTKGAGMPLQDIQGWLGALQQVEQARSLGSLELAFPGGAGIPTLDDSLGRDSLLQEELDFCKPSWHIMCLANAARLTEHGILVGSRLDIQAGVAPAVNCQNSFVELRVKHL